MSYINTKISTEVIDSSPDTTYDDPAHGELPVAKRDISTTEDITFYVITDTEFAEEQLRNAKKDYRTFGELPDKGQFPYIKHDTEENTLIFHGHVTSF